MKPVRWAALVPLASRVLAVGVWLLGTGMALVLALAVTGWLWSGTPASLAQTLSWGARQLSVPDTGQSPLLLEGVTGNLRQGGTVQHLRWQQDGLTVEVTQLEVRWSSRWWWDALVHRRVTLQTLSAQTLAVRNERPETPPTPRTPPDSLRLPWVQAVSVPLHVEHATWGSGQVVVLNGLQASYRYGHLDPAEPHAPAHHLQLAHLAWAEGDYSADLQVKADLPMALQARLQGVVRTPATASTPALTLAAQLGMDGPLVATDTPLTVTALVEPEARANAPTHGKQRLQASARIAPWANLPVTQADLNLQDIDLALFWPGAPNTRLNGRWRAWTDTQPATAPATPPPRWTRSSTDNGIWKAN